MFLSFVPLTIHNDEIFAAVYNSWEQQQTDKFPSFPVLAFTKSIYFFYFDVLTIFQNCE